MAVLEIQPLETLLPAPRPALTLLLGPAGSGKTTEVLARFAARSDRALLLVASNEQGATCARQIAARTGQAEADIQTSVLSFHNFVTLLGRPDDLRVAGRAFQRMALADLFAAQIGPGDFLGRMHGAPGFADALAERIREWKLAGLSPDALEAGAEVSADALDDPTFARKARELARLYRAYETFLAQNGLCDPEDLLRIAARRCRESETALPNRANLVLADGFYRFTQAQRALLHALAERGMERGQPEVELIVSLPHEAERPLPFAAPDRTLSQFRAAFATQEIVLARRIGERPEPLVRLEARLFASAPDLSASPAVSDFDLPAPLSLPAPAPAESAVLLSAEETQFPPVEILPPLSLNDAPNPYVEVEMAARAFRRLHETGRYAWSDFAIILRTLGDYAPILSAVFERYAIPLGVDGPERLTENPLIKTLLHLLAVVRYGWQRDDVLAFVKSSYTAPDKLAGDALRHVAQRAGVRADRADWLQLVVDEPDNTDSPARVLRDLADYDRLLTDERAAPGAFAALVCQCIAAFGLEARLESGERVRAERDRAALKAAKEVLEDVTRLAEIAGRGLLTFAQFHDDLLSAWQRTATGAGCEGDRVRVVEPYDARERPTRVAVVMGLTERVFPRRIVEDPFLRDDERRALQEAVGVELEPHRQRTDDERFLFYLAVTAPQEKLILSFPRSAADADTLPSFYLDEVRAVFAPAPNGVSEAQSAPAKAEENPGPAAAEENPGPAAAKENSALAAETESPARFRTEENPVLAAAGEKSAFAGASASPAPPLWPQVVSRTLADVAPRPHEAVSSHDRLLAACADLFDPDARSVSQGAAPSDLQGGLQDDTAPTDRRERAVGQMRACLAEGGARAWAVLDSRALPRLPRLTAPDLRADFAHARAVFSASDLEAYQRCPFQYLLGRALRLRRDEDGANPRAQGELLHGVLRRFFRHSRSSQALAPDADTMRAGLNRILTETLARSRMDASPHRLRMTHRILGDALDGFADREARFRPQFGMTPTHFELAFGFQNAGADWLEDDERETPPASEADAGNEAATPKRLPHDPASCAEPLWLTPADGGAAIGICGVIDRVDLDATGQRALILDYKIGTPPEYADIQRGRSLQMPLYLLALERLWGKTGAVACYDSMRERGRRRLHRLEHVNSRQFAPLAPYDDNATVKPLNREQFAEIVANAEVVAVGLARAIGRAEIAATPGDHCQTCAYGDVCRSTRANGHDGEALAPPPASTPTRPSTAMPAATGKEMDRPDNENARAGENPVKPR